MGLEGANRWRSVFERGMDQKVMVTWKEHMECWSCGLAIEDMKLKGETTLGYL
jgi:hypothetical protein